MDHSRLKDVMEVLFRLDGAAFIRGDHGFVELLGKPKARNVRLTLDLVDSSESISEIANAIGRQLRHPQLPRLRMMQRIKHEGDRLLDLEMEPSALRICDLKCSVLRSFGPLVDDTTLAGEHVSISHRNEMRLLAGAVPIGIEPQALCYELRPPVEGGWR